MVRLEPFDGVARLPMSKVSAHLENLSSFSAIKLDIVTREKRDFGEPIH
jgi:hypothetical protein